MRRGEVKSVMAETFRLTPGETVTIRTSSAEVLEVEGRWAPEGKPPPPHLHPAQDERFEVIEGSRLRAPHIVLTFSKWRG